MVGVAGREAVDLFQQSLERQRFTQKIEPRYELNR